MIISQFKTTDQKTQPNQTIPREEVREMENQSNVTVKGVQEFDDAVKTFNDSVSAMKQAAYELARLGAHIEIDVNDLWKSRQ